MIEQPPELVDEWRKTMSQYKDTKTKLPWGTNPPVTYVTEKTKKMMDAQYDPILQKFTDTSREEAIRGKEQNDFIQTLAKNKVLIIRDD